MSTKTIKKWRFLTSVAVISLIIFPACETSKSLTQNRIKEVEDGLLEAVAIRGMQQDPMEISQRMQYYKVPGVSIAVIDGLSIEWARGYGMKEAGSLQPAAPDTLFQSGALSEFLTAACVFQFIDRNRLELDKNIYDILRNWKIPPSPHLGNREISLSSLLLHQSGLISLPFPGYGPGEDMPSLLQLLRGEKPSNAPPIYLESPPGKDIRPDGADFLVIQMILEEAAKKTFQEIMSENILSPLKMFHTTFLQELPSPLLEKAASGHLREGDRLEGRWRRFAAQASRGMWSTPSDLGIFMIAAMEAAMGKRPDLLTAQSAQALLSPQLLNWGFGATIDDRGDNINIHAEGATPGFTSYMIFYPVRNQGAVIMTNSDNGRYLTEEILRSIARTYEWPHFQQEIRTVFRLDPALYPRYEGKYQINPRYILNVTHEDYYLVIQPSGQAPTRFYVKNPTTFFSTSPYIEIKFKFDDAERITGLTLKQAGFTLEADKIE